MKKIIFALFTLFVSLQMAATACEAARGSFYTMLNTNVEPNRPILLDQQYFSPVAGLHYALGTGNFVITEGGIYTVAYGFSQTSNGGVSLALDGEVVQGSQIFGNQTSATICFHIEKRQILSLINASNTSLY